MSHTRILTYGISAVKASRVVGDVEILQSPRKRSRNRSRLWRGSLRCTEEGDERISRRRCVASGRKVCKARWRWTFADAGGGLTTCQDRQEQRHGHAPRIAHLLPAHSSAWLSDYWRRSRRLARTLDVSLGTPRGRCIVSLHRSTSPNPTRMSPLSCPWFAYVSVCRPAASCLTNCLRIAVAFFGSDVSSSRWIVRIIWGKKHSGNFFRIAFIFEFY